MVDSHRRRRPDDAIKARKAPFLFLSFFLSLASLSTDFVPLDNVPLFFGEHSRGRFKTTGVLKILRLLFSNPDSAFVPHKSRVTHTNLVQQRKYSLGYTICTPVFRDASIIKRAAAKIEIICEKNNNCKNALVKQ